MKCPLCDKEVKEVIFMNYERAWVSASPQEGLSVYGAYSSDKGDYCEWKIGGYAWGVHLGEVLILKGGYDGLIPKVKEVAKNGD